MPGEGNDAGEQLEWSGLLMAGAEEPCQSVIRQAWIGGNNRGLRAALRGQEKNREEPAHQALPTALNVFFKQHQSVIKCSA